MNSKEQHRQQTVNERLDALIKSTSEFADATVEKFEKIDAVATELRVDHETLVKVQTQTELDFRQLLDAENSGRVRADDQMHRIYNAFVKRGFWARMNWLFTGR